MHDTKPIPSKRQLDPITIPVLKPPRTPTTPSSAGTTGKRFCKYKYLK